LAAATDSRPLGTASVGAMEVRVLGPVEVVDGDRVIRLEPAKRTLLGALAARPGQRVAIDDLIDALWPRGEPRTARKTVQGHIARLRREIGDAAIVFRAGGYVLDSTQVELDVVRVEALIARARQAAAEARYDEASQLLEEASGLFRGRPYEGVPDHALPPGEQPRLDDLRSVAFEERIDAELSAGRHRDCIGDLESFLQANPLRERGWAQLMIALYRSHRQADALRAYSRLRTTLATELGIEPSTEVTRLEQSILAHDPTLEWPATPHSMEAEVRSAPGALAAPPPTTPLRSDGATELVGMDDALRPARDPPPNGTHTRVVMFTDVVGSTEWRSTVGDPAADAVRRDHDDLMTMAVQRHHGSLVKGTGDGFMTVFNSSADAVDCAVAAQHALARYRRRYAVPLHVRIGIAAGDVAAERGDYFGVPVAEAARLAAAAPSDGILASQLACLLAGSRSSAPLFPPETVALDGLPEGRACRVDWQHAAAPSLLPMPDLLVLREILLAGREAELTQLARAWAKAERGRCQVMMVTGEPGIGKTRLVTEAARRAHHEGGIVLYGRCDEGLGAPFRPMVEALRPVVAHLRGPELAAVASAAGPQLARLLPELESLVDRSAPTPIDSDVARVLLFDAVAAFVAALGTRAPVLLALDDLQWADEASLLLLRHIVTRSQQVPVMVLATYRDTDVGPDHQLQALVADLRREDGFHRVALAGLDKPAVAALAAAADPDGEADQAAFADDLLGRTSGNPFFILQLIRHFAEESESEIVTSTEQRVPDSVREVISRRLSRLPARAGTVLRLAAVVGEDFDLPLLESVEGTADELDAVEAAVAAGLVTETTPNSFRFVHALVRQTLYAELSGPRRVRLHRAIGEGLAQSRSAPAADVARHLRAGAAAGGLDDAIEWTFAAIQEAFTHLAREDVATHAAAALELLDHVGEHQSERRARLLCELSIACTWLGDISAKRTHALAAADIARTVGSTPLLIEAALLYTDYLAPAAHDPVARQLLQEALQAVGQDQPAQRSQLLCNEALHRAINDGGGLAGGQDVLEEATQLARSSGDDTALAWALTTLSLMLVGTPDVDAQLRAASELEELLNRSPQTREAAQHAAYRRRLGPTTSIVIRHRGISMLQQGNRAAFDHNHRELRILADANHDWLLGAIATMWDGLVALIEGRLEAAELLLDRVLDTSHADPNLVNSYSAQLLLLRRDQGRIAEVLPLVENLVATSEQLATARAVLALIYTELGRDANTRRVFEGLATDGFAALPRDITWPCTLATLAELCWHLRDRQRATLLEQLCEPYTGQFVILAWGACCLGAMDRYRGMLADVLGETDLADRRFADAAALEDRANAIAPLARTRLAWAASILQLDEKRARRLIGRAATTAADLGLHGLQIPIGQLSS
jgi:DNA-binding SARP family transcriptional activator/class 3 adenylate cyclase